ncbi:uncharacterized protein LODBEIA_P14100 [Lodderomyces beijingensis]|uniref:Vitamin B6 transporter TPN1 n=1 Tax=Lodderomyces beijingensis TaxID=1775926 RepID=A0ABP0ZJY7_9ASCO
MSKQKDTIEVHEATTTRSAWPHSLAVNSSTSIDDGEQKPQPSPSRRNAIFHWLSQASRKLDSLGVETRGIERIEPYERSTNKTKQLVSVIGLWLSACGGLSSMSSFFLGPLLFELGLRNTLVCGLTGHTLGCVVAAYCSLMGTSGLRQMISARFLFGWWFVKLVALVSLIALLGWSVVNCLVGGQILASLSNEHIPVWAGIIIVAAISLCAAIGGIKPLMRIEAALSLPVNFAFLLLYVVASQKFQYLTLHDAIDDPATIKGNWLSFFSLCYSITSTWGSIASDYYILFPETTPDLQIFCITFFGIWAPTTFVGVAGMLIGNVALTYKPWGDAYANLGMGGLLNEAFKPWGGGGKFLLVLIFLSLISNNILNTYSAAFGVQLAGSGLARIPRWLWAIALTAVYLICALVGRQHFATILSNFLPMVGYWISMYFIMLLEENLIFRQSRFKHLYVKEFTKASQDSSFDSAASADENEVDEVDDAAKSAMLKIPRRAKQNYNWRIWNDITRLTRGYAATAAFCIGASGAAIGMSQTYWVGPLAKLVGGEYGGDIAMWLCMGFSGITYPWLRYAELKYFKR